MTTSADKTRVLLDTNAFLRLILVPVGELEDCLPPELLGLRTRFVTVPQVVYESWATLTRPVSSNGMGLEPEEAGNLLRIGLTSVELLKPDEQRVLDLWQESVVSLGVRGRQAYDARIVSAMKAGGISAILTNDRGFRRFGVETHVFKSSADRKTSAQATNAPSYPWFASLARTLNSGQSRSILLHGPVHDLYHDGQAYRPLVEFLVGKCEVGGLIQLVYELNGPIRIHPPEAADRLRQAWVEWKGGGDPGELALASLVDRGKSRLQDSLRNEFDSLVHEATGSPAVALEFLRQLTVCSRATRANGRPILDASLLIWIEAADLLVPAGDDLARLNAADRHRVIVLRDWFGDAGFQEGRDGVVLLSESRGGVHRLVSSLPQVLDIEIDPPDIARRRHYIEAFGDAPVRNGFDLPANTAGLSIHALRQLLLEARHADEAIGPDTVVGKVEAFVRNALGEDVVEFKRPSHTLGDVIGNSRLKTFLADEFIPRLRSTGDDALPGAAVAGPIGAGKTFIFEAVAGELGVPVLVLKNIRSQWYGQTDVLFEQLRRLLTSLGRVVIFVDEADTAFGGVGGDAHETERRLTGKVQQMMSDPSLRGRVSWLLMTARIERLSPDIRRPGRVGDLILPVLDPIGQDRLDFIAWTLRGIIEGDPAEAARDIDGSLAVESAAGFASLRSRLKARVAREGLLSIDRVGEVSADFLPPAIGPTRRYQALQALVNCTRRSLLPDPESAESEREAWEAELRQLAPRM
jgi:predicted nucleic acid-binding protein